MFLFIAGFASASILALLFHTTIAKDALKLRAFLYDAKKRIELAAQKDEKYLRAEINKIYADIRRVL